jgi:hypothetical protein
MSQSTEHLRNLLVGAKVLEIKDTDSQESMCELYVEKDGKKYSFTLFATDLGWWIADVKDFNGDFDNFQDLIEKTFEHYNKHCSSAKDYGKDRYESFDSITHKLIGFRCKECGKEFNTTYNAIKKSEYADLLKTPEDRKRFAKLLSGYYIQDKANALERLRPQPKPGRTLKEGLLPQKRDRAVKK